MHGEANSIARELSVPTVARTRTKLAPFSGVMRVVRSCLGGDKYDVLASDLALSLGCSERTAKRIIAGQMVRGDTTLAVLTHDALGAPFLAEVLSRVPVERRAALAEALIEAADIARIEAEQHQLARQLAERKARR